MWTLGGQSPDWLSDSLSAETILLHAWADWQTTTCPGVSGPLVTFTTSNAKLWDAGPCGKYYVWGKRRLSWQYKERTSCVGSGVGAGNPEVKSEAARLRVENRTGIWSRRDWESRWGSGREPGALEESQGFQENRSLQGVWSLGCAAALSVHP